MPQSPLLVGVRSAAEMLGISRWTLQDLMRARAIPFVRIGRRVLLETRAIDTFIEERRVHE
jgi:excisionase family DNA binding protein